MACRMEDAGLDSIWVYDHLLYRWPGGRQTGSGVLDRALALARPPNA